MEAAFVVLTDGEIYNYVRSLQVGIRNLFGAKESLKLEPHFTIKYAFNISDLEQIEQYFDCLVKDTKPFEAIVDGIDSFETKVVFLKIAENEILTNIHLGILKDVEQKIFIAPSEYEGKNLHFHITLAYKDISEEIFRKIMENFQNEKPYIKFTVKKLGLYLRLDPDENWFIYKEGRLS